MKREKTHRNNLPAFKASHHISPVSIIHLLQCWSRGAQVPGKLGEEKKTCDSAYHHENRRKVFSPNSRPNTREILIFALRQRSRAETISQRSSRGPPTSLPQWVPKRLANVYTGKLP